MHVFAYHGDEVPPFTDDWHEMTRPSFRRAMTKYTSGFPIRLGTIASRVSTSSDEDVARTEETRRNRERHIGAIARATTLPTLAHSSISNGSFLEAVRRYYRRRTSASFALFLRRCR